MSEEHIDSNEQTRSAIERLLPKAVAELEELIESGGKRSLRLRCEKCGNTNTHEVKVADADLLVKAVSALSSAMPRLQSKDDPRTARAVKIQSDKSEMTDAELTEYIANLEAQLDADQRPD